MRVVTGAHLVPFFLFFVPVVVPHLVSFVVLLLVLLLLLRPIGSRERQVARAGSCDAGADPSSIDVPRLVSLTR